MSKFTKVLATFMLMTAIVFFAGCKKNQDNSGFYDGHEYVDLGLPSGTLWATCNVGASSPEDYGDYFAWGETHPKDCYDWSTYKYCNGDSDRLTKYCNNPSYGNNNFTDNLTTLMSEDDAATVNWDKGCHIPTANQWKELTDHTSSIWTTQNGVNGRLFTAKNGKSLFLPAAGCCYENEIGNANINGYYWSSSLYTDHPDNAWIVNFYSDRCDVNVQNRFYGPSVRPVRSGN